MPLNLTCPHCQKTTRAPDGAEGKKLRCPQCHKAFRAPGGQPQKRAKKIPLSTKVIAVQALLLLLLSFLLYRSWTTSTAYTPTEESAPHPQVAAHPIEPDVLPEPKPTPPARKEAPAPQPPAAKALKSEKPEPQASPPKPAEGLTAQEILGLVPAEILPDGKPWGVLQVQETNAFLNEKVKGQKVLASFSIHSLALQADTFQIRHPNSGNLTPVEVVSFRGKSIPITWRSVSEGVTFPLSDREKLLSAQEQDLVRFAAPVENVIFSGDAMHVFISGKLGEAKLIAIVPKTK